MKILKVFSNKNFKNVSFNEGYNVILANIHHTSSEDKKDTHNLGKTSLISVIDFVLLANFEKGKGLLGNEGFAGQVFYVELKLNNDNFLIIRRSIDEASKVSFKSNDYILGGFDAPTDWDEEYMPYRKAKKYLDAQLAFDVIPNWDYRKSITYFLRSQQDYLDVFKLDKFKGKHINWKPYLFDLLGSDGELVKQKLLLEKEVEEHRHEIKILAQEANIDTDNKDRLLGYIDIKKKEVEDLERHIDQFNFFLEDNSITKEVVEQLDAEIQLLNTERYRISSELSKTEKSITTSTQTVDVAQLKKLFSEVELYFPQELAQKYDDLAEFNRSISTERKKYLSKNFERLTAELNEVNTELKKLETDKSNKLSFLTEKDSYTKFKDSQKKLSKIQAEIYQTEEKLRLMNITAEKEECIATLNLQIKESVSQIKKAVGERKHASINRIFNDIINDVLGTNALLSIETNNNNNLEFLAEYTQRESSAVTSESKGTSYKKLLCMSFDLALLIHQHQNSFFRFAYHDGILEGLDNRVKIRLFEKIKSICVDFNIQHILTVIDSDLPIGYELLPNEICLKLNDKDDSGKLFLRSF